VRNHAALDADSVWIIARDESLGVVFMDTVVTVPALDEVPLTARFSSSTIGLHGLSFRALTLGGVEDLNPSDGRVTRLTEVVALGGVPTVVDVPGPPVTTPTGGGIASRVIPNPSHGSTLIEFDLPLGSKDVRVLILDVTGRLVARLALGHLQAGRHRVPWRIPPDSAAWRSGVYFYRIQADGLSASGRIVSVQ
jgi:hypothetical protein